MVPWYVAYGHGLVTLAVFLVVAAPPAWFGAALLNQFNSHVKDKRVREKAVELAKYADQWLESAMGKTDTEKAEEVIANLIGAFGIGYAQAKQATEAAVYDLHSAVHDFATLEPATLIQGTAGTAVDHSLLAAEVSTAVAQAVIPAVTEAVAGSGVSSPVAPAPQTPGEPASPSGAPLTAVTPDVTVPGPAPVEPTPPQAAVPPVGPAPVEVPPA
jgi:hypothetical protein